MADTYRFYLGALHWYWFLIFPVVWAAKWWQSANRGAKYKTQQKAAQAKKAPVLPSVRPAPAEGIRNTSARSLVIHDIDQMNGREFEKLLQTLFEQQGYEVKLTPYCGDWGADLVLAKGGSKTVVQAKRWHSLVGVQGVQEVVAAKAKYQAENAMVITNSRFTYQAQELARVNEVSLWNRDALTIHLRHFPVPMSESNGRARFGSSSAAGPASVPHKVCCDLCGHPVSASVEDYCRAHEARFGGQIFCYDHQGRFRKTPAKQNPPVSTP